MKFIYKKKIKKPQAMNYKINNNSNNKKKLMNNNINENYVL